MSKASDNISIAYLLGTIENSDILRFQRLLYRISRGTAFTTVEQIDNHALKSVKHLHEPKARSVVLIVFRSGRDRAFGEKVMALCQTFNMRFYEYINPADSESRVRMNKLSEKVDDTLKVLMISYRRP
jgi:hypothetical protein